MRQKEKAIESKFMPGWSILRNGSSLDSVEDVSNCQSNCCCSNLDIDKSVKHGVEDFGWSILRNGSALDSVENVPNCQSNCCCSSLDIAKSVKNGIDDSDEYTIKLRCLFDEVIEFFLKEIASMGCIRPVPAMLGNGKSVDLFKLFWVVRKRGGYELVSKKGLWDSVAEESGLDREARASVKLIYCKYVTELDKWLKGCCRDRSECGEKFGLLSLDLESEFRDLLSDGKGLRREDDRGFQLESNKNGRRMNLDIKESELSLSGTKNVYRMHRGVGNICSDDGEKNNHDGKNYCNKDNNDPATLDATVAKKDFNSRKRKRGSLSRMLKWVTLIAKNPNDPAIGRIPEPSKWKEHVRKEFWAQAILVREALLQRIHDKSKTKQSPSQKKLKVHPSIYEDDVLNHQSTERLGHSKRLPTLVKSHLCSCCTRCSTAQRKLASACKTQLENCSEEKALVIDDLSKKAEKCILTDDLSRKANKGIVSDDQIATSATVDPSKDDSSQKHVSMGVLFQAEVPEWTGVVSESDPKWLGTQTWPSENGEGNSKFEMDPVGRGRPDLCGCRLPGSVECIRFHIAEKRMKLKLELGSVFFRWRFDRMGEEVSIRWTDEEEKRFKNMVRLYPPSLDKTFWDVAPKYFPRRKREELVNYYFNVFLVQRRRYQNRVTPKNIDSDDDEMEFGSVGGRYGHEAIKNPGSNFLICAQSEQCTDFE